MITPWSWLLTYMIMCYSALTFMTCHIIHNMFRGLWVTIYHMVIIVYWKPGSRCKTHVYSATILNVCQLELWEIVGLPMPNFAKNGNSWALSGNSDVVWLWDNNHVHSWSCCDHVMIMHDHIMIRIGLLYILLLWLTHDHDHDHALGMITAWSWSWMWVIMHDHVILSNSVLHTLPVLHILTLLISKHMTICDLFHV